LYKYISTHPDVYCPALKEPKYLTNEFYSPMTTGPGDKDNLVNNIFSLSEYKSLYAGGLKKKFRIDASADLLYYYEKAIPHIKKLLGDPHIIIILRNPVERAFSAYLHLVRDKRETLSFEKALKLEDERIKKNYEFIWHYKMAGLYSAAVKAYVHNFSNALVLFQEDLNDNSAQVLNNVYKFLSIPIPLKEEIKTGIESRQNQSKVPKYKLLESVLFYKYKLPFYNQVKAVLSPWEKSIKTAMGNLRQKNKHKPKLPNSLRLELQNFYFEDIKSLTNILENQKIPDSWLKS